MKRLFRLLPLLAVFAMAPTSQSHAQIIDAIREALIAAIKAADIVVQKVQNATIDLQNAQKVVENELTQLNLGEIGDWEAKMRDLYSEYYDELKQVKTAISYFKEITGIISQQSQLVSEYKKAFAIVQQDNHFTPAEIAYINQVYTGIIAESLKSIDEITLVLTNFSLQMTDAARLALIRHASADIERLTSDLRKFNNQTAQLSLQRAKNKQDIQSVMQLYGLP
jgi:flagellin-specific chaperone FliS